MELFMFTDYDTFTSYDNYSLSFLTLFSILLTNLLFCLQWKKDVNRRTRWRPYENSLRKKDRMYICSVKYALSQSKPLHAFRRWMKCHKNYEHFEKSVSPWLTTFSVRIRNCSIPIIKILRRDIIFIVCFFKVYTIQRYRSCPAEPVRK